MQRFVVDKGKNSKRNRQTSVPLVDPEPVQATSVVLPTDIYHSDPDLEPTEAVFVQWARRMFPAPANWTPWVSPNGKVPYIL